MSKNIFEYKIKFKRHDKWVCIKKKNYFSTFAFHMYKSTVELTLFSNLWYFKKWFIKKPYIYKKNPQKVAGLTLLLYFQSLPILQSKVAS